MLNPARPPRSPASAAVMIRGTPAGGRQAVVELARQGHIDLPAGA